MYVCLFVSASLAGHHDIPAAKLDSILAQALSHFFLIDLWLHICSHALRTRQGILQGP